MFRWKYINIMFFVFHWLAMSNSCYNPFIYGIYSVSIAFLSGNSTAHDQSWARDNTATNP